MQLSISYPQTVSQLIKKNCFNLAKLALLNYRIDRCRGVGSELTKRGYDIISTGGT